MKKESETLKTSLKTWRIFCKNEAQCASAHCRPGWATVRHRPRELAIAFEPMRRLKGSRSGHGGALGGGFVWMVSSVKEEAVGKWKSMQSLSGSADFFCGSCPTYLAGNCKGCVAEHEPGDCYTHDCVIESGLNFCGECTKFPCDAILQKPHDTVLDKSWLAWKKTSNTNR